MLCIQARRNSLVIRQTAAQLEEDATQFLVCVHDDRCLAGPTACELTLALLLYSAIDVQRSGLKSSDLPTETEVIGLDRMPNAASLPKSTDDPLAMFAVNEEAVQAEEPEPEQQAKQGSGPQSGDQVSTAISPPRRLAVFEKLCVRCSQTIAAPAPDSLPTEASPEDGDDASDLALKNRDALLAASQTTKKVRIIAPMMHSQDRGRGSVILTARDEKVRAVAWRCNM